MKCPNHGVWVEYVHDHLDASDTQGLKSHLDGCAACRETVRELSSTRDVLMDSIIPEKVPGDLHQAVMDRIHREQNAPGLGALWRNLSVEFRAIVATLVMAVVVILLHQPDPSTVNPDMLLAFGIVWGVTNNSVFRLMFDSRSQQIAIDVSRAALAGLAAFLLAEMVALVTPNPVPFENRSVYLDLAPHLPAELVWVLPAFYSIVGVGLVGLFFHRTKTYSNGLFLLAMSIVFSALMTLVLWLCFLIDQRIISPTLFAAWVVSIWIAAPATAWLVSRLPTRKEKERVHPEGQESLRATPKTFSGQ